jgi:hypothetical protein
MSELLVRFIRGTLWDSRLIEFKTRSWTSHVEAVYPVAINGRLTFGAMLRGGVKIRNFNDREYRKVQRWEIWHIPCTDEQHALFWQFLYSQEGKPYDWRAIVSFSFGERDWQAPDSWFCSELMAAAGMAAKLWNWPAEAKVDRIDPGDAYLLFATIPGAHL